jgi:hypothetical protein
MKHNPTRLTDIGHALILQSRASCVVYDVGAVSAPGYEDFSHASNPSIATTLGEATTIAKGRVGAGGKIYLFDISTREWSVLASLLPTEESIASYSTHHAQG